MVLLARTTPIDDVKKPSEGLSLFFVDFDKTKSSLDLTRITKMEGRVVDSNEVFFDDYIVPTNALLGKKGKNSKLYLLSSTMATTCY
jgi:acyl-CoA dehydrogenase